MIDWTAKLTELKRYPPELGIRDWRELTHLVILPFHREPYEVVRDGLAAIVATTYPKNRMIVVLGVEARAGDSAREIAERLAREYGEQFLKFIVVVHPSDIEGELPGKGANETYAARAAVREIKSLGIPSAQVIVSSLDIDTVVPPGYFSILTHYYCASERPLRTSYQPIPVYNNNIWEAPAFSRVVALSGTFWQTMQQTRPERLSTFSSHSMPLSALEEMGYWHTNIVSEDSRIFWQALLYYDGDYRAQPLYYPVYMDANVASNAGRTAVNVYKQQRRWAWGAENFPYLLFGFIQNRTIPFRKKFRFSANYLEGLWSWSTNSLIIFLLGWLPITIGANEFGSSLLAYNLPRFTRWIMTLSMVGIATSAYISMQLLPPRPAGKPVSAYFWMVIQWIAIPVTIILFGAVPALEAQTRLMLGRYMGFWVTPKFRNYTKSGKRT